MRLLEWESPGLSVNRNSKDAGRRRANKDTISVKKGHWGFVHYAFNIFP